MLEGLRIVDACLRLVQVYKPTWWALENPVGRLQRYLGPPVMTFNPCEYGGYLEPAGDHYTKRTCLWGTFTRPVPKPVEPTQGSLMHTRYGGKTEATRHGRATFPRGFAAAFYQYNQ